MFSTRVKIATYTLLIGENLGNDLNITRAEAAQRAQNVVDPTYIVSLEIDGLGETYSCLASINFSAIENSTTWIDYISPEVESIWLNGTQLDVKECFNGSRIKLSNLKKQNELKIKGQSK